MAKRWHSFFSVCGCANCNGLLIWTCSSTCRIARNSDGSKYTIKFGEEKVESWINKQLWVWNQWKMHKIRKQTMWVTETTVCQMLNNWNKQSIRSTTLFSNPSSSNRTDHKSIDAKSNSIPCLMLSAPHPQSQVKKLLEDSILPFSAVVESFSSSVGFSRAYWRPF